jgi:hypothetical protein
LAERIVVYCYEVERQGEPAETRWSLAPVKPAGYAGSDEPKDANPMGNEPADVGDPEPAGHVEAPDGTRIVTMEPPVLEIPGHGRLDLLPVLGASESAAPELGRLVRWMPRRN